MATTQTNPKPKQRSYFVTSSLNRFYLDDGESFIEHKALDEGLFQAYQDLTSQIKISGDSTEVDMKLGAQRKFLFENVVTGWNLVDDNEKPVPFSSQRLMELPPHLMNKLYDDIFEQNEILRGEREQDPKVNKK